MERFLEKWSLITEVWINWCWDYGINIRSVYLYY